jgi:hypothetical protein
MSQMNMPVDRLVLALHRRTALVVACLTIATEALWWSSTTEGRRLVSVSMGDSEGYGVMTIEDNLACEEAVGLSEADGGRELAHA